MFNNFQKKALFFSCFILIFGVMAMDFINPSLPYLIQGLHTNQQNVQQLIVIYMLGLGMSQFFYGTFSDNYGRKKTILIAYIISITAILLSAMANSITTLYLWRFITGIGSGGATMISRSIIVDSCNNQSALKKSFAWFAMSSQLSPALAPIIGGFIQQYTGSWRMAFLGLASITFLAAIIIGIFMTETHTIPIRKKNFTQQILVYLTLFKLRRFMSLNFISTLIYIFTIGYYCYMPFILVRLNFTPVENGLTYTVYAGGLFLGSLSLRVYLNKFSSTKLFLGCCGLYILVSGSFYLYFTHANSVLGIIFYSALLSFLCGVAAPLTLSLCLTGFEQNKGAASAVQSFVRMFFTGIILYIFNFIPLRAMANLLEWNIIVSVLITIIFLIELGKNKS
jgi:MFS family permease